MVTATGFCVLFALLTPGAPDDAALPLQYWVVEGSFQGRDTLSYDATAQTIRSALQDLRFDTYRTLHHKTIHLEPDENSRLAMKDRYTLILHYAGREQDGRARVDATVELAAKEPDTKPRKVVQTTLLLSKEKARIGGLRTEKGELVLLFATQ